MTTDPGDLVLDPTCGSGTTAYVAEQWGRRWITIDTSRVAIALARTRLMAAAFPLLPAGRFAEGIKKEAELTGQLPPAAAIRPTATSKRGFVYKRVPHVTLKSIANNEEIDAIHAKWQAQLEPLRAELNRLLKQTWEDWQIPREPPDSQIGRQQGATSCTPSGGTCAASASRRSTPPSPAAPTPSCSTTSPTRTTSACASPALSRSRACRRIGCCPPTGTARPARPQARTGRPPGQFETMILDNLRRPGCRTPSKTSA